MKRQRALKRSELKARAEEAWRWFGHGDLGEPCCPFKSEDEARAAWQTVRAETLARYQPIGTVDAHGLIEFGPNAWWWFEAPEPFKVQPIEGLPWLDATEIAKYRALVKWGYVDASVPCQRIRKAEEDVRYCEYRGPDYMPAPTGPNQKEQRARMWADYQARKAAYIRLGYITQEDIDNGKYRIKEEETEE